MKKLLLVLTILFALGIVAAGCGAEPQVIEKEVIQTVVVEKPVEVEKEVVRTVIVEKPVEVEKEVVVEVEKEVLATVVVEKAVEVEVEKEVVVTPTPAPKGGDLVIAMDGSSEPALLDSQIDPYAITDWMNQFMTGELLCLDAGAELQPYLATDWEISDDGLAYTFYLRDDVTFSDGTPFNAEAVKYNVERILAPETASVLRAQGLEPLDRIEIVDDYTVIMHLKEVNIPFLHAVASAPIWSPTAAEKYGLNGFPEHLTGAGPYIFKENVPRDHVTVVRNPDFKWPSGCVDHHAGQPADLESVTWQGVAAPAGVGCIIRSGLSNGWQRRS